jgi:hypothetical protein
MSETVCVLMKLRYIVNTFVSLTVYPRYNNIIIKIICKIYLKFTILTMKKKKERTRGTAA